MFNKKFSKSSGAFCLIVFVGLMSSACIGNKKVIYLQDAKSGEIINEEELISYNLPEYRLQYNDIIDIRILTAEDLISDAFSSGFSNQNTRMMGMMGPNGGDVFYMNGYTVNKRGMVTLPILGDVRVGDLTLEEAREIIEIQLKDYLTSDFFLRVKLGGIRFATLGEFNVPGKHTILQDRLTIFEAIAASGDLTLLAKRDELLLIRQYPDGSKLHRVNLMDKSIIKSPFYFIQPNDQLYAEPMKVREVGSGENFGQAISLFLSSASAILLILNLINR